MGCEDFLVRLLPSASQEQVISLLLRDQRISHDASIPGGPGESHFRYEDPDHIIEVEVAGVPRTQVSLRFAVCQSVNIDHVFTDLVVELAKMLTADTMIAEDVQRDDPRLGGSFGPTEERELRDSLLQCIPKKRLLWQADVGTAQARVSCKGAIERFVIAGVVRPVP